MAFDNYVTGAVCAELDRELSGARVERVYQPEREELIICLNRPPTAERRPGRLNLFISASSDFPATYITWKKSVNPANPPAYCMMLRKYLLGAKLISVRQLRGDRIAAFEFSSGNELGDRSSPVLIAEMMGKHSNIILLDSCPWVGEPGGARILDAIKRVSGDKSRVRQTLPGMYYDLPPEGKGLSPLIEKEMEAFPEKDKAYFDRMAERGEYRPTLYYYENAPKDFHVFDIGVYGSLVKEEPDSVSEMLETYYSGRNEAVRITSRKRNLISVLSQRLSKAYTKKQRLLGDMAEAEKAEELRFAGELINANIYRLQSGQTEALLPSYDDEGNEMVVSVKLDPRLSPAANAQKYFRKYRKSKTAITEKAVQLKLTEDDISYLESVSAMLDLAEDQDVIAALKSELEEQGYIRKRRRGDKPGMKKMRDTGISPIYISLPSGAEISIGRNNRENDYLTFKSAGAGDIWFHTKDIPGSHVILRPSARLEGKGNIDIDPSSALADEIMEAASYAAWYSKARGSENVPVDYVFVRYVKKPAAALPGMVIFTHNRTVYVNGKKPSLSDTIDA